MSIEFKAHGDIVDNYANYYHCRKVFEELVNKVLVFFFFFFTIPLSVLTTPFFILTALKDAASREKEMRYNIT